MPPIDEQNENTQETTVTTPDAAAGSVTADPVVVDPSSAVDTDAAATPAASGDPAAPADPAAAATPAFVPNFKVKVMDKDHEIPESLRSLIKDDASQKEIADLVTKALGFEHSKRNYPQMKETLTQREAQLSDVQTRYNRVEAGYSRLQGYLDKGDMQSFRKFWKIDDEKLLRHAAEVLRYREMSPEERAAVDQQREIASQAESRGSEAQHFRGQAIAAQAQLREFQLDTALSKNDVSEIAKQFDARAGQPGAFKARIIRTAQMHAITTQKDISVDQAIHETMAELGYDLVSDASATPPASQPGAPAAAAQKIVAPVQQKKLPVIPAGTASGASPVKRTFKSVADLERERDRLAAR